MEDSMTIIELENMYNKRIQQLEKENLDLLKEFLSLQRENEFLRNKYEHTSSGEVITESYDIINAERIALKEKVAEL